MNIHKILRKLGINMTYKGYNNILDAVKLVEENPDRLHAVCKEVYAVIGKTSYYHGTAVERNIRTIAQKAYQHNPELLSELVGYTLTAPPTASQFIEALAVWNKVTSEL